jgi:hypothetical protein
VVELIDHYAKGPHVGLGAIDVVEDAFGGHVEGRADVQVSEIDSKSRVGYLE